MNIEFDPIKDRINIKAHKFSLLFAQDLDWDNAYTYEDDRYEYGEQRMIGIVPNGDVLYFVVYVEIDDETIRVISLRRAIGKEKTDYVRNVS